MSAPVSSSSVSSAAHTISSMLMSRKAFSLVLTMSSEVFFLNSSTLARFSLIIILFSTLVGNILVLFLVTTFAPVENTLSEEADEAGMASTALAMWAKMGRTVRCFFPPVKNPDPLRGNAE